MSETDAFLSSPIAPDTLKALVDVFGIERGLKCLNKIRMG